MRKEAMNCESPIIRDYKATSSSLKTFTGKRDAIPIPCGSCLHCRINQSRIWATRILLEQKDSKDSVFIGLTYDEDHYPENGNLIKAHLQNFLKRYRRLTEPHKIRYYACGEYGKKPRQLPNGQWTQGFRPHFHVAMFGKAPLCSNSLFRAWPHGNVNLGELNSVTARYITGYITEKLTKCEEKLNYVKGRTKEFATMSKGYRQEGGLGIGVVRRIAKRARENRFYVPEFLSEITIGNRRLPIGRYLSQKLAQELGVDRYQIQEAIDKIHREDHEKYISEQGFDVAAWHSSKEGKRKSQKKKHKIFKSTRSL